MFAFTADNREDQPIPVGSKVPDMQNAKAELTLLTNGPLLTESELEESLGWSLKPEGLCRDDVCVLVPDRGALERDHKIDVMVVADRLDRPATIDETSGTVAIGAPRQTRRLALHELRAPEFSLPDLDGTWHALSDHRSKKKLLVAFSSW
jgi:hypothetical protein